ncbi:thiol reductant ABC exporter subunit CydD [Nitrincola alkalilacustris]|uniref:thiol reductant ABC exporter subunit CydD n=1 Tax=Nitrincola alkalilacustris TaxID=1571224 RepID=UPI00124E8AF0|nr:thiol reductant ABC exporter subunit CydD [Nitrincola alkalilacustris]
MQQRSRDADRTGKGWLKRAAATERRWIQLSVVSALLSGGLLIYQAHLLASVIYFGLFEHRSLEQLSDYFLYYLAALVGRVALSVLREWSAQRASIGVRRHLRQLLLQKLASLGPAYTQGERSGELSSALLERIEALDGFIARYLPQVALAAMLPLVILSFVLTLNWAAALIFLVSAPLIPLMMILVGRRAAEANRQNFRTLANLSAYFLDVVQGLGTLKLFNRSKFQHKILADNAEAFRSKTMQVLRLAFLSTAVLELFAVVSMALVAIYLAYHFTGLVSFGTWSGTELTLYHALVILILAPEFYLPLKELGTHYHAKQEAVAAAERLQEILEQEERTTESGERELSPGPISLELDQIGFSWHPGQQQEVLKNISLTIEAGQMLALVGPSGVGKSTLMGLLLGFLRPSTGEVRINGIPLSELKRDNWLQQIAWVSQQTTLFPGTLRENLLLAAPDASDEQLLDACRQSSALEFVERLPQGLDSHLGEMGSRLSAGQIQRLALARAFLKDAPVLLLDEPTASLDKDSEDQVLKALAELCKGRTVLLITHRLGSMRRADRVCRLDAGGLQMLDEDERSALLAGGAT